MNNIINNNLYEEYFCMSSGIYIEHNEIKEEILNRLIYSHKLSYVFYSTNLNEELKNKYIQNIIFKKVIDEPLDLLIENNLDILEGISFMIYLNKNNIKLTKIFENKSFLYSNYNI